MKMNNPTYVVRFFMILCLSFLTTLVACGGLFGSKGSSGGGPPRTDVLTGPGALLSWDANSEADLSGYKVYYHEEDGNYTAGLDAGLTSNPITPTYAVNGLTVGVTYFFVVTAYDNAGNESGHSNEVSKTIL